MPNLMEKYNLLKQKHNYTGLSSLNFPIRSVLAVAQRLPLLHQSSGGEFWQCSPNTDSVMCHISVGQN